MNPDRVAFLVVMGAILITVLEMRHVVAKWDSVAALQLKYLQESAPDPQAPEGP